jgi:psp operon transcriptional activator
VRELKHIVERAAFRCDADELTGEAVEASLPGVSQVSSASPPGEGTFEERAAAFEKSMLSRALQSCHYSQKDAAQALGLTYDQFRHLYRKYGLKDD